MDPSKFTDSFFRRSTGEEQGIFVYMPGVSIFCPVSKRAAQHLAVTVLSEGPDRMAAAMDAVAMNARPLIGDPPSEPPIRAFLAELVGYTRFTPKVVNHDQVMRLVSEHLPEQLPWLDELLRERAKAPHHDAQPPGEGAHGAGPGKTP